MLGFLPLGKLFEKLKPNRESRTRETGSRDLNRSFSESAIWVNKFWKLWSTGTKRKGRQKQLSVAISAQLSRASYMPRRLSLGFHARVHLVRSACTLSRLVSCPRKNKLNPGLARTGRRVANWAKRHLLKRRAYPIYYQARLPCGLAGRPGDSDAQLPAFVVQSQRNP
jgi:hypothetical protein